MNKKAIMEDPWIDISFGISTASSKLIESKKELKEYAEEIDWIVSVDKEGIYDEEIGIKYYDISLGPENHSITPAELSKKIDLVKGFLVSIREDILNLHEEDGFEVEYILGNTETKSLILITIGKILRTNLDLKKAIMFERKYPKLFKRLFSVSINTIYKAHYKEYNKIFVSSENRESALEFIEIFEENGIKKIIVPEPNIFKKILLRLNKLFW